MRYSWKQNLSLIVGLILTINVYGDTLQSLNSIEQVAYEYALSKAQENFDDPHVLMGKLDARLRLQKCDSQLQGFSKIINTGLGNQTVGVKCLSPVAWTVYVPVQVKVFKSVVVATRTLAANKIISKDDVKLRQLDVGSLHQGYVKNITQLVGQQLKYSVAMDSVIKPQNVRPQKIIQRGESIILIAMAGSMEVRMNGTAMADASLGQRVRVKNNSSKRVIEGVVDAPGIVKVAM